MMIEFGEILIESRLRRNLGEMWSISLSFGRIFTLILIRPPQAVLHIKDANDHKILQTNKELYFFKMHDFEIFQTYEGSKNMNYSLMPATKNQKVEDYKGNMGKSELNLRKSALPERPNYMGNSFKLIFF